MNKGIIQQIIGPVIDIKFDEEQMPNLLNAIHIEQNGKTIVAEVEQHIGADQARCIALSSTDGMYRGMEATDTGEPIKVPVGKEVLGRLFNVLGETIDEKGPVEAERYDAIHRRRRTIRTRTRLRSSLRRGSRSLTCWPPTQRAGRSACSGARG